MKRTTDLSTGALALDAVLVGTLIWIAASLSSCATVRTVADVGTDLCRVWMAQHPERAPLADGLTCDAIDVVAPFVDAVNLAAAKPQPEAIKEALAAHPPLSSAAALAMPCLAPPPEPQSRIEKRLYPFVVTPPRPGE